MGISVRTSVPARTQESSFMNATLQDIGDDHSISIAVHLPAEAGAGVDLNDEAQVRMMIARHLGDAAASGCSVEVQIGPNTDGEE